MTGMGGAATAVLAAMAGSLFLVAARHVQGRQVPGAMVLPNRAYVVAWSALAAMMFSDAARLAMSLTAQPPLDLYLVLMQVKAMAMSVALCGFGIYVAFLWQGHARAAPAIVLVAAVHGAYFLYGIQARAPISLLVGRWGGRAVFHGEAGLPGGIMVGLIMFFAPLALLCVVYAMLARHVPRDRRARLWAVVVSLAIFAVAGSVQANPDISPDRLALPLSILALLAAAGLTARAFLTTTSSTAPSQALWRSARR